MTATPAKGKCCAKCVLAGESESSEVDVRYST